eukprot:9172661-Ditylum_brightwellii.AAC.2
MLRKVILILLFYGFIVDTVAGDGAAENSSTFKILATVTAQDIFTKYFDDETLKGLPLDTNIAFKHPNKIFNNV